MSLPEPPIKPEPIEKPRGSWLSILLTAGLMVIVIVTLTFLSIGFFGYVIIFGAGLALIILMHYVVWGWWMQPFLKRAMEEEERQRGGQ